MDVWHGRRVQVKGFSWYVREWGDQNLPEYPLCTSTKRTSWEANPYSYWESRDYVFSGLFTTFLVGVFPWSCSSCLQQDPHAAPGVVYATRVVYWRTTFYWTSPGPGLWSLRFHPLRNTRKQNGPQSWIDGIPWYAFRRKRLYLYAWTEQYYLLCCTCHLRWISVSKVS